MDQGPAKREGDAERKTKEKRTHLVGNPSPIFFLLLLSKILFWSPWIAGAGRRGVQGLDALLGSGGREGGRSQSCERDSD